MKMRWLAAGITAVLITGGAATVAQRVITQKTRGVLPEKDDAAHADSRAVGPIALSARGNDKPAHAAPSPDFHPLSNQAGAVDSSPTAPLTLPAEGEPALVVGDVPPPASQPVTPTVAVEPSPPTTHVSSAGQPPVPMTELVPADPSLSPATTLATPIDSPNEANPPAEGPTKADPVDSVEAFVERNRKEAESAIETLTTEAANLKSRLTKVEVALARWQTFSRALNSDQIVAQPIVATPGKPKWNRSTPDSSSRPADSSLPDQPAPREPRPVPDSHPAELPVVPPVSVPQDVPPVPILEPKPADVPPTPTPDLPTEPQRSASI